MYCIVSIVEGSTTLFNYIHPVGDHHICNSSDLGYLVISPIPIIIWLKIMIFLNWHDPTFLKNVFICNIFWMCFMFETKLSPTVCVGFAPSWTVAVPVDHIWYLVCGSWWNWFCSLTNTTDQCWKFLQILHESCCCRSKMSNIFSLWIDWVWKMLERDK